MTNQEAGKRLEQWLKIGSDGTKDERIGYIEGWFHQSDKEAFERAIKALEQEPKTGKWEDLHRCWICSECGYEAHIEYNYCPNCGAKMEEGSEE